MCDSGISSSGLLCIAQQNIMPTDRFVRAWPTAYWAPVKNSKDDDGIDKKADNGKDKITNLDAVDSVMIDEVKDGNAPAHADLGGKNKDSADDKDDDVVSDGDSAILDELKFVVL